MYQNTLISTNLNPKSIIHLKILHNPQVTLGCHQPFTIRTNLFVASRITRDPQWNTCLILPTIGTTHMIITQDLIHHHIQIHVVVVIIKKQHQLPMIKSSYHPKSKKVMPKHVHHDLNSHFQVLIHLGIMYRNPISYTWSFTIDPDLKK